MSNTLDVINTRSSIRAFKAEMIDENLCRTLVEAGLKAPTATNRQEIHITVTTNDNPVNDKIQKDLNPNAEKSFYYHAPLVFYLSGEDGFGWTAIDAGIAVENLNVIASIGNQEAIKKAVRQGMGISVMSRLAAEDEIEAGKLLIFAIPGAAEGRDINLVYNKNYELSRSAERFIRVVKEVYKLKK